MPPRSFRLMDSWLVSQITKAPAPPFTTALAARSVRSTERLGRRGKDRWGSQQARVAVDVSTTVEFSAVGLAVVTQKNNDLPSHPCLIVPPNDDTAACTHLKTGG